MQFGFDQGQRGLHATVASVARELTELAVRYHRRRVIGTSGHEREGAQVVHDHQWSFRSTSAGGTSLIQRNLIAELILGMPKGR